jgi:hypothetical protein
MAHGRVRIHPQDWRVAADRSKYDKWRRWLDGADGEANGKITNEVVAMHARRVPWRELTRLANRRDLPSPDSYWWEWVVDCYAVTQSIAIRRQLDQQTTAVSLGRILRELVDHPGAMTRELWLSSWEAKDDHDVWLANKQWDEKFASADEPAILNPALPTADLKALEEGGHRMRGYVDRHVAHLDRRGSEVVPTFNDIDDAVDLIGALFTRYHALLTASGYTQLEPAFQDDWAAPLRTAWLPAIGH